MKPQSELMGNHKRYKEIYIRPSSLKFSSNSRIALYNGISYYEDMKQEVRDKISRTMKGRRPNNYGIPRSIKAINKFKETIKSIRGFGKWNIGNVVPDERRQRISDSLKKKIPKNLPSIHLLPRTEEWRRKIGLSHKGMKHTEKTKRKISDAKRNILTPLHRAIRECYKSRQWRTDIFRRDNFTCVLCGIRGIELNADHYPKRFVDIVKEFNIKTMEEALSCEDLWNITKGRTLCLECHCKTETYGNKFKKNRVTKVTE